MLTFTFTPHFILIYVIIIAHQLFKETIFLKKILRQWKQSAGFQKTLQKNQTDKGNKVQRSG